SLSSSSKTGAIILHGPHQGAQKSTSTVPDFTSSEKFWSVTSTIAIMVTSLIPKFQSDEHSIPLSVKGSKVFRRAKKGENTRRNCLSSLFAKNTAIKIRR